MEKRFRQHPSETPEFSVTSRPSSSQANHAHLNHQLIRVNGDINSVPASSVQNPFLIETLGSAFSGLSLSGYDRRQSLPFPPPPLAAQMSFGNTGNSALVKELLIDPLALNQERYGADFLRLGGSQIGIETDGHLGGFYDDRGQFPYWGNGNFGYSGSTDSMLRDPSFGFWPGGLLREDEEHQCWRPDCCLHGNGQSFSHRDKQLVQFQQRVQSQMFTGVSCSNSTGLLSDTNSKYMQTPKSSAANVNKGDRNSHEKFQLSSDSFSLWDLRGRILWWAKDQNGCRFLQMKFEDPKEEEIEMAFSEVIENVDELMTDPFANYLFQKLVEVCSEEQRTKIISSITKTEFQLVNICTGTHGTRSVQKLLTHLTNQEQISLAMAALRPGIVALIKDLNGHHVIQHCLSHFSAEENEYLMNEVPDHCFEIATDKTGCCVLQFCINYSRGEAREHLVSEIIGNAVVLSEDCYGNYVVQYVLGLRIPQLTERLLKHLEGSYFTLSCNKYGSHVVEKCITESNPEQSAWVVGELLKSPHVSMLLLDPFGNFVIQKALSYSKGFTHNALLNLVRMHTPSMRSNLYGKKVLAWFDQNKLKLV